MFTAQGASHVTKIKKLVATAKSIDYPATKQEYKSLNEKAQSEEASKKLMQAEVLLKAATGSLKQILDIHDAIESIMAKMDEIDHLLPRYVKEREKHQEAIDLGRDYLTSLDAKISKADTEFKKFEAGMALAKKLIQEVKPFPSPLDAQYAPSAPPAEERRLAAPSQQVSPGKAAKPSAPAASEPGAVDQVMGFFSKGINSISSAFEGTPSPSNKAASAASGPVAGSPKSQLKPTAKSPETLALEKELAAARAREQKQAAQLKRLQTALQREASAHEETKLQADEEASRRAETELRLNRLARERELADQRAYARNQPQVRAADGRAENPYVDNMAAGFSGAFGGALGQSLGGGLGSNIANPRRFFG